MSINGPALRAIREALGLAVADVVAALQCNPSTISKLETGARQRASPIMVSELCRVLGGIDRRALLACPYGEEVHDAGAPAHDEIADTAEIERPDVDEPPRPVAVVPDPRCATTPSTRRNAKHRAGAR